MAHLGILCGMAREAAALGPLADDPRVSVVLTGARAGAARAGAERLIAEGAEVLLSWGIGGALAPELAAGDLVLATVVRDIAGNRWPAGPAPAPAGTRLLARPVLGADRLLDTPAAKRQAAHATGAAIVDMESHHLARAALTAGRPFAALRAVSDPVDRALPPLAADALGPDGRPRTGAVLAGLARRPGQLPALLAAARDSAAALAALRRFARAGGLAGLLADAGR